MVIDGKKIANDIIEELNNNRHSFSDRLRLGVVMQEGDAAIESFVTIKERVASKLSIDIVRMHIPKTATTGEVCEMVATLAGEVDALIVQLPLSQELDTDRILAAVPAVKDVDALNTKQDLVRAPVAEAISEILLRANISARGKRAVILGSGRLVGAPALELLKDLGADVSVVNLEQGSLSELKDADIIISGAGSPGIITQSMLKENVVLIDAGTSESGGKVVGDANPACAEVASVFTPVPGGVGPIAVAMLFANFFTLLKNK